MGDYTLKMVFGMEKRDKKIWLATPTMHGEEIKYMQEAYDTNWMSTLGENINQIEKQVAQIIGCNTRLLLLVEGV